MTANSALFDARSQLAPDDALGKAKSASSGLLKYQRSVRFSVHPGNIGQGEAICGCVIPQR